MERIIYIMKTGQQKKIDSKLMYKTVWLAFVDMQAKEGEKFSNLIDLGAEDLEEYLGAWGNLLIISDRINNVPDIIEAGLNELDMTTRFIDKIENVGSLIEYGEIDTDVMQEAEWLFSSGYVFKISDKIFPYIDR